MTQKLIRNKLVDWQGLLAVDFDGKQHYFNARTLEMKVWLLSYTLTKFAHTKSLQSALFGLMTLALATTLTSNCFGQFTVGDVSTPRDEGHSILVHEGERLDSDEPRQSGAAPKPYHAHPSIPEASGGSAFGAPATASDATGGGFISSRRQSDEVLRQRVQAPSQPSSNDVIVDHSVSPASYTAPVQSFQNQSSSSSSSLQPLQRRQNTGQATRYQSQGNQAASTAQQRHGNRSSTKKTSSSAKVLIARFGFKGSQGDSNNSVPLRLADVLNRGQGRANRGQLIDQYWQTFAAWAQSVSAKQHRDWVNGLQVSKSTDQSTFGVAKSSAENEVTSTHIQLGKSQTKLQSILGTRASIVPVDLPTVTMVKTNFQAFKERGLVPAGLENIDQTLKELHDLLLSRADTVLLAERTAEQVEGYYKSNRATIEQLLGAGRAWRTAESDFVSSTIEYNKAYTDYALALPYGRAPVEQVVAMLVVPANVTPTAAARRVKGDSPRARISATPSQSASSIRPAVQGRVSDRQVGQGSRVRAASASNGFGPSRAPQSRQPRPMPDFSESYNASAAAASFASPKTQEFHPNSVAPQQVRAASAGELQLGSRKTSQPATQQVSQPATRSTSSSGDSFFGGGKKPDGGFSGGSANRSTGGFSNGAKSEVKGSSVNPFSSQPSTTRPTVKPPVKPSSSFGGSGSKAADAAANKGFSSGFRN